MLSGVWSAINGLRRVVANLVFLALLVLVLALLFAEHRAPVHDGSALLLRPAGRLVEQGTVADPINLLKQGASPRQTTLRDVLEAVDAAADDARIRGLVIETDALDGAGLAKLQEVAEAIARFRASGKPVLAWGSRFTQGQYLLASQADELYMAPDGFVLAHGFANYPTYFKGLFDKLGVRINVFRVGSYKSAVEPYTREDMSPQDREASRRLLGALWSEWRDTVAARRPISTGELDALVEGYPARLAAVAGDAARLAKDAGLVDGLLTADQWQALLIERFGRLDDEPRPRQTALGVYLADRHGALELASDKIAVVAVQGAIVDGEQPPGLAGGETVAKLLRQAREDDSVKALVLRVDSPGGSVFASERIRREVDLVRQAGKPVIASMSSVAASGGYWVSMGADEVWASPSTVTGSIGIFGMFPDVSGPMREAGLAVDGVGTSPLAGGLDPRRPLSPELSSALQSTIEHGYRRFVGLVAGARSLDVTAVERVAQGQVWTGAQALEHGLVDHLGGLREGIEAAAARASLTDYQVTWIEPGLNARDRILARLIRASGVAPDGVAGTPLQGWLGQALEGVGQLARWNDPGNAYAHCLCGSP
ncbi:MAG: signal peptide peptidase SppA [Rhodocyclaceae bacterium]|nr:signal peptide peptidase SppA [Rhodocyclaceae bacterium]